MSKAKSLRRFSCSKRSASATTEAASSPVAVSDNWRFVCTSDVKEALYRLKVQTCSDNAPTVAPDKVPRNRRLRAGSFLREQQRVAAPSSRVAFACVSLAAAPTATPCFRHWRRSLQLQNPRFRPCAYARGPTSRTFAGETPSPQPSPHLNSSPTPPP